MEVKIIEESSVVYEFLKNKRRYDYIYQFTDLEQEQWKKIICYGLYDGAELKKIAMLSTAYHIPVLLAAGFEDKGYSLELLKNIKDELPEKFYAHIDQYVLDNLFSCSKITELEHYMNMGLSEHNSILNEYNDEDVVRLGYGDMDQIKELLAESYPGAWLDEELVKLNKNFGVYQAGKLISFAGIHAYSKEFQVAAVAHVTTHPKYRNQGYGEKVVAALVKNLKRDIKHIGLNVKIDNIPAVSCYKKLGFVEAGRFSACEVQLEKGEQIVL